MKHLKTLCLLAFAVLSIGIVNVASAAAAELPSILYLSSESTGESSLSATSTTAVSEFTGIRNLKGTGYAFTLNASANMAELGPATLHFDEAELGETKCNTAGDATGKVLVPAEWHIVPIPGGTGTLFLITETAIKCGSLTIKVKGSELSKNNTAQNTEVLTSGFFEGETGKCTGKKPAFSEYSTDSGTGKAKLESSIGLGFEESCEQISEVVKFSPSRMMEFMTP